MLLDNNVKKFRNILRIMWPISLIALYHVLCLAKLLLMHVRVRVLQYRENSVKVYTWTHGV